MTVTDIFRYSNPFKLHRPRFLLETDSFSSWMHRRQAIVLYQLIGLVTRTAIGYILHQLRTLFLEVILHSA